jgi:hypothetical protein
MPDERAESIKYDQDRVGVVEQVDLTGMDFIKVHQNLTNWVKKGYILHGSSRDAIETLEPSEAQFGKDGRRIKAVFATDDPTIAIARSVAGKDLLAWSQQILLIVDEEQTTFPANGYVYLCHKDQFRKDIDDPSEYFMLDSINPAKIVKLDSSIIEPFFRSASKDDYLRFQGLSLDQIVKGEFRQSDATLALLAINNLFEQAGYIDEQVTLSSEKGVLYMRLWQTVMFLEPLLAKMKDDPTAEQKNLFADIWGKYRSNVYGDVYAPAIEMADDQVFETLNKIRQSLKKARGLTNESE